MVEEKKQPPLIEIWWGGKKFVFKSVEEAKAAGFYLEYPL
jgi:hypothetical protein